MHRHENRKTDNVLPKLIYTLIQNQTLQIIFFRDLGEIRKNMKQQK